MEKVFLKSTVIYMFCLLLVVQTIAYGYLFLHFRYETCQGRQDVVSGARAANTAMVDALLAATGEPEDVAEAEALRIFEERLAERQKDLLVQPECSFFG